MLSHLKYSPLDIMHLCQRLGGGGGGGGGGGSSAKPAQDRAALNRETSVNWYFAINKGIGSLDFFTRTELSFLFYVNLLQKKTMFT